MLIKVLATGFFSRQDTKTPVKIGIIAMTTNMVFNIILFYPLEHVGLALATAISAIVNSSLLFIYLKKDGIFIPDTRWKLWFAKIIAANGVLITFIYAFMAPITTWQEWSTMDRASHMLILVFGSVLIYAVSMFLLRVKMSDLRHS